MRDSSTYRSARRNAARKSKALRQWDAWKVAISQTQKVKRQQNEANPNG